MRSITNAPAWLLLVLAIVAIIAALAITGQHVLHEGLASWSVVP